METIEYLRYLESDQWHRIREQRLKIDNHRCCMCGSKGTMLNPLQIHHVTYKNIGEEDVYKDVLTLCDCCHKAVHMMMSRVTDKEGHRGWKDNLSYSRHVLEEPEGRKGKQ